MNKIGKIASITMVLLVATVFLTILVNAQEPNQATVIIESAVGGTTSPGPNTYYYNEGTVINLKAIPDEGYEFVHWIISGVYESGHNQPQFIVPPGVGPEWIPPAISLDRTGIDNLVVEDSELDIICGFGYTFSYRPVFSPVSEPGADVAVVVVGQASGGTTSPPAGSYEYAEGTTLTLRATPNDGFVFQHWVITGTYVPTHNQPPLVLDPGIDPEDVNVIPDLPRPDRTGVDNLIIEDSELNIICGFGYTFTYQPVFVPAIGGSGDDAVVIVKASVGGSTDPSPGTYTYANGHTISLTATPAQGFEFKYWIISGSYSPTHNQPPLVLQPGIDPNDPDFQVPDLPTPDQSGIDSLVVTESELNVICGYGYTYSYQPIFSPVGVDTGDGDGNGGGNGGNGDDLIHPPFGLSSEAIIALIAILVVVVVIAVLFGVYMYTKRGK